MWTTSFRAGSRQSFTAKRLNTYNRPNHVAINVTISGPYAFRYIFLCAINAAVHTKSQAVVGTVNFIDDLIQIRG